MSAYPTIVSREPGDLLCDEGVQFQFLTTEYIKSPLAARKGDVAFSEIEPAMAMALSNPHTFFILERLRYFNGTDKVDLFRSCFNYLPYLQESLLRAADTVEQAKCDYLVFSSTPHDLEAWLVFLYAHQRGMRTFAICQSELPWRVFGKEIKPDPVHGCKPVKNREAAILDGSHAARLSELSAQAEGYIAKKRGDYVSAEPKYMKVQKTGDTRSVAQKLLKLWQRLRRGPSVKYRESASNLDREIAKRLDKIRARRLRKALNRYATDQLPSGNFVSVFLHFQPERTSVPEGGRYAPQINAIAALRDRLPSDWHVVVKEHPSMFLLRSKRPFRHPDFYRVLAGMPNLHLVDDRQSSFELIDASRAVATLTGTVGFEALCRGKPVIAMGDAAYRHYPGAIDLFDRNLSGVNLMQELDCAETALQRPGLIEEFAARTEVCTFSDSQQNEFLSRDTMKLCLMALAENMVAMPSE